MSLWIPVISVSWVLTVSKVKSRLWWHSSKALLSHNRRESGIGEAQQEKDEKIDSDQTTPTPTLSTIWDRHLETVSLHFLSIN